LKTYYINNNIFSTQASKLIQWDTSLIDDFFLVIVISVLQQISVNYLEQALSTVDINDEIKAYIYKERAQYLEQIYHSKHIV
jgi:hypothetical protein